MYRLSGLVCVGLLVLGTVAGCGPKATNASSKKNGAHKTIILKLKVTKSDLKSLTPPGYTIKKWVTADLDRDKKEELILACQSANINQYAMDNPPATLMAFSRKGANWQKVWQFAGQGEYVGRGSETPQEPVLEASDINKDGAVELIFSSSSSCGATDMNVATHIYSYRKDRFVDLLGNKLGHMLDAGVILAGRDICLYQSDWDDYETNMDPHHYRVTIYGWDGKRYALKKEFLTGAKGKEGEREAKRNFQAFLAGKPIVITKHPIETTERIDPSLYRDSVDEMIKADLKKRWISLKSPGYVLDLCDRQCFEAGEEDVRVLAVLKTLTQQYRHRLAIRVKSGYDTNGALSRESDPGWTNISAHSRGRAQAFDIFYADGIEIGWQASTNSVKQKKAQNKIRQLLKEILVIGAKQDYYLPTQLCVYRRDDILAFQSEARQLYGGYPPETGLRGMQAGDRYWDRIHIGY